MLDFSKWIGEAPIGLKTLKTGLAETADASEADTPLDTSDEALRAAYQAAINPKSAALTLDGLFDDTRDELGTHEDLTTSSGFLERNRVAVTIVMGLCILASAAYAGLAGYWWLSAGSSQAAEPVNMLNVDDTRGDTRAVLKNIETLQQQGNMIQVEPEENPEATQAKADLLAQGTVGSLTSDDEKLALAAVKDSAKELVGRADPFQPLVRNSSDTFGLPLQDTQTHDVLTDVRFTGFIGDAKSADRVGILKISDPTQLDAQKVPITKTVLVKAGSSITVEGQTLLVKSVQKDCVNIKSGGKVQMVFLEPYKEPQPANAQGAQAGSSFTSSGSSGSAAPASVSGPVSAVGGISIGGASASAVSNVTSSALSEAARANQ